MNNFCSGLPATPSRLLSGVTMADWVNRNRRHESALTFFGLTVCELIPQWDGYEVRGQNRRASRWINTI